MVSHHQSNPYPHHSLFDRATIGQAHIETTAISALQSQKGLTVRGLLIVFASVAFCLMSFSSQEGVAKMALSFTPSWGTTACDGKCEDIGLRAFVSTTEVNAVLAASPAGTTIRGRTSFHLETDAKRLRGGRIDVRAWNLLYRDISEALLTDTGAKNTLGELGFVAAPGGVLEQTDDGVFEGTLEGRVNSFAQAKQAKPTVYAEDSSYDAQPAALYVRVEFDPKFTFAAEIERFEAIVSMKLETYADWHGLKGIYILNPKLQATIEVLKDASIVGRTLCIQPVFFGLDWGDADRTGDALDFVLPNAHREWGKARIRLDVRPTVLVTDPLLQYLKRPSWPSDNLLVADSYQSQDCIEVFFIDGWIHVLQTPNRPSIGGAVTYNVGRSDAFVIVSDENDNGVDATVLAHEIGHVLCLMHPGEPREDCLDASAGTLMCTSGFGVDNPEINSRANAQRVANPLLTHGGWVRVRPGLDCDDTDCGSCS